MAAESCCRLCLLEFGPLALAGLETPGPETLTPVQGKLVLVLSQGSSAHDAHCPRCGLHSPKHPQCPGLCPGLLSPNMGVCVPSGSNTCSVLGASPVGKQNEPCHGGRQTSSGGGRQSSRTGVGVGVERAWGLHRPTPLLEPGRRDRATCDVAQANARQAMTRREAASPGSSSARGRSRWAPGLDQRRLQRPPIRWVGSCSPCGLCLPLPRLPVPALPCIVRSQPCPRGQEAMGTEQGTAPSGLQPAFFPVADMACPGLCV